MSLRDTVGSQDDDEAAPSGVTSSRLPGPIELRPLGDRPLVSVLVPNKDYGRFLGDALESVRQQTYAGFEVIVCDDGSSDDSVEVIQRFVERDPRFRLVRHERSRGQGAAFNSAFGQAHGDVVAFLDADDTFAPGKLGAVVGALVGGIAGVAIHPLMVTDADGRPVQRIPAFTRFEDGWIADRVIRRGGRWRWVPTSGIAMHRDVADVILPMPEEGFTSSADTFFLMLVPLLTPVTSLDQVLGGYRRHGDNVYARARLDPTRTERMMDNMRLSIDHVNQRLVALGADDVALRPNDNLKFQELSFQSHLFEAEDRRTLFRRYTALRRAVGRDDLYGATQKRWAALMYLVAVGLPRRLRARWLSLSLSASSTKDRLRRLIGPPAPGDPR